MPHDENSCYHGSFVTLDVCAEDEFWDSSLLLSSLQVQKGDHRIFLWLGAAVYILIRKYPELSENVWNYDCLPW